MLVAQKTKELYLVYLLRGFVEREGNSASAVVFTSTLENCHFLFHLLREAGFLVTYWHSLLKQGQRKANLEKFR